MPIVVRALPGTGKTWLAKHTSNWVDGDVLLERVAGDSNKEAFDRILGNQRLKEALTAELTTEIENGRNIAVNFDPGLFGVKPDLIVQVHPSEYVAYLRSVKRTDLLDSFSEKELEAWAAEPHQDGIYLRPGQHLTDILKLMKLV